MENEPAVQATAMYDPLRRELRADCERCFGLCCVALPFAASADFAFDKEDGSPCRHLRPDHRCGIHSDLRSKGMRGCTVFDCFGAGQKVSQVSYDGIGWRERPATTGEMFDAFRRMRQLHELLWYLADASTRDAASSIRDELRGMLEETERLTRLPPERFADVDIAAHRANVDALLTQASELVRADSRRGRNDPPRGRKRWGRGIDLIGADLAEADLVGAYLRGAYMIAADLRGADLRGADVIGADFRDADLSGADLSGALFLTQAQLEAAKGDAGTKLPPIFERPAHWLTGEYFQTRRK
jgi:uncharacterized protein YjbI with pentapeptide repeats